MMKYRDATQLIYEVEELLKERDKTIEEMIKIQREKMDKDKEFLMNLANGFKPSIGRKWEIFLKSIENEEDIIIEENEEKFATESLLLFKKYEESMLGTQELKGNRLKEFEEDIIRLQLLLLKPSVGEKYLVFLESVKEDDEPKT